MNKKTVIIIVIVISFIFLAVVGAGFFIMWNKLSKFGGEKEQTSEDAKTPKTEEAGIGPVFPLDTFIVNLAAPGANIYLKITINLEMKDDAAKAAAEKRLPQIRDLLLTLLPTKNSQQLQSAEGKQALRNEIMTQLNALLKNEQVKNVYFTDFVIQ